MQYIYTECELPSNGKLYPMTKVHIRPKTIFDIKMLLNNPFYMIKSEIDTLQNCIDPKDNINVYDLVNQDVVYLLYKLRSLSYDTLNLKVGGKVYPISISELQVKYLDEFDPEIILPKSGIKVTLTYQPIKNLYELEKQKEEFIKKFPDYKNDVANTIAILNSISAFGDSVDKDIIRNKLEQLSWEDSITLIQKIEEIGRLDFGIVEEAEIEINNEKVKVPLQITEEFFRPAL